MNTFAPVSPSGDKEASAGAEARESAQSEKDDGHANGHAGGSEQAEVFSHSKEQFDILEEVGQGTYGQVYKATHRGSGKLYALKRVKMDQEKEGFPITALREIKILKQLKHESIVHLKTIVSDWEDPVDLLRERTFFYMVL